VLRTKTFRRFLFEFSARAARSASVFASVAGFHDAQDVMQQITQDLAPQFDDYNTDKPFPAWALWIAKFA